MARFDPNKLFFTMWDYYWLNKDEIDPETGKKALIKIFNKGSSRSSKTIDAIHLIIKLIDYYSVQGEKLVIDVYRDTLVRCRDLTFEVDFKKTLRDYIILQVKDKYNKKSDMPVWDQCKVTAYPKPKIEWRGCTINFKGVMDTDTQPAFCDISFFNEVMEVQNMEFIRSVFMRTTKLAICDWNPTNSQHQIYKYQGQFNCLFTHTTFLDNKHLPDQQYTEITSKCPWSFEDFDFETRKWLRPECPDGEIYDENIHRRPNKKNIENGTATKRGWLVYGEGMDSPAEGAIFDDVEWIKSFPETGMEEVHFGLDFGYSNDPSCLTRNGIDGNNLYSQKHTYQNTPTVDVLFDLLKPHFILEENRRKTEAGWKKDKDGKWIKGVDIAPIIVACDSADKYKDTQFVRDMNVLSDQFGYDWQFVKVKKSGLVPMIATLKRFKLFIVDDPDVRVEQQNYIYLMNKDNTPTNMPDPDSKYCHFWDSVRYCVWHFFKWRVQ